MNKSILYSRKPKSSLLVAFAIAAAIHASAVAFVSRAQEQPVTIAPQYIDIEGVPAEPEPTPEQAEIQPLPQEVAAPSDFHEPVPAPRHAAKTPAPIRPRSLPLRRGTAKAWAISAPRPEYPYEARSRRITGSGVVIVTLDVATGNVVDAKIEQSMGHPILDNAALSAFRRWRFKPGTPEKVRIPITYQLTGAHY